MDNLEAGWSLRVLLYPRSERKNLKGCREMETTQAKKVLLQSQREALSQKIQVLMEQKQAIESKIQRIEYFEKKQSIQSEQRKSGPETTNEVETTNLFGRK